MGNTAPTAWVSPDFFVGKATLSAYEPYPVVSGTAYSSNAPASALFIPFVLPNTLGVKNIVQVMSMNAVVPQATSANSSGSEGYTYQATAVLYSRQDYAANSTNLTALGTGLGGVTGTISYSSTAQSLGISWLTDTAGGVGTFSTTSGAGNWSSFVTGAKFFSIPFSSYMQPGEYWMAFQYSSTTGTSNSNLTLLSFSQLQQNWVVNTLGSLGGSASIVSSGVDGMGIGIASALTTNNTMAASVISATTQNLVYFALSNV